MSFQTVPPQSDLQGSIPAGRMAVAARPYVRPKPAFGPGSTEYVRQQAEELGSLTREEGADTTNEGNYAGAGSYF